MKIIVLTLALVSFLFAQEQNKKDKFVALENQLKEEQKQIQELLDHIEKLKQLPEDDLTQEKLKDYPERIKEAIFPKNRKSIIERLQEIERQLQAQRGVIKITYKTGFNVVDAASNGDIVGRQFRFHKKEKDSILRITYHDTFRTYQDPAHARWYVKIDSKTVLTQALHGSNSLNIHRGGTIFGYVQGIAAGDHVINISVNSNNGESSTGWESNFTLQVEEIAASIVEHKK